MAENDKGIRLNKYLSEAGICSRREADKQVEAGNVLINGKAVELGQKVMPGDEVIFKGKKVGGKQKPVILLVNKPKGIVSTAEKRERDNIVDFVGYPTRLYPVGRLDKDSHGLILLTNVGELMDNILKASNNHEKEYIVRVNKPITADFIHKMSQGVYLTDLDKTTRKCQVEKLSKYTFKIILMQGLNRQIRRMCMELGYRVQDLERVRIVNLTLDGLGVGEYRKITDSEYEVLKSKLKGMD
ncbi:MAG: pseudouridine synthase [Lachnospiraceae bacterium]|nr:pseudouridine synthase [Lachnospiraceae bacterium]